ncbi:laminin B domain-containing protein [Bradyrhizobium manausense]|uniref:laminin B domain-containing protein n=1 Tax=Bradyrhizobium manausense TaxID=989370 RepID=UPI001BAAB525|nr:laminin B domain-containing protein [Bradyrhizobium manausense]MBR0726838.1 hypothetical protein [Bradyrhizobium manausense]
MASLRTAAATAFAVAISVNTASAITVSENFDNTANGVNGWIAADANSSLGLSPFNSLVYNATGGIGNSGYISTIDPSAGTTVFVAPKSFASNMTSYLGGTLSFSLFDAQRADINSPVVIVYGANGKTISFALGDLPKPGTTFTPYSIALNARGWTFYNGTDVNGTVPVSAADFAGILADATLTIQADWHTGDDNTGLDRVSLTSAVSAVPEASTWTMMILGFFGTGFMAYRRKSALRWL